MQKIASKSKKLQEGTINWLLEDDEPSIKYLTLTELLGEPADSVVVQKVRGQIAKSKRVMALFSRQVPDGGFGYDVYDKWMGAFWRLPSLVDLAIPDSDKRAIKAANTVLDWLTGEEHQKYIRLINGLTRRCACQEGTALGVCCYLGIANDFRVKYLADSLISWQWPDGGWNCDKNKEAHHSSFHESVIPMWGLLKYHEATGNKNSLAAARKTSEFMLRHHLFRSEQTGEIINPRWLLLHYPHYWHYDVLQGLRVLSQINKLKDARAGEALDIIEQKRLPDGKWKADGYYWKSATAKGRYNSPVDWWRRKPNKMLTLNAMRVLKAAGRIKPY
jgi:hypothetical protein